MALGDCPASLAGVEFGTTESSYGVTALHSADWLHSGDTATAFLDGSDSGLPSPTKF